MMTRRSGDKLSTGDTINTELKDFENDKTIQCPFVALNGPDYIQRDGTQGIWLSYCNLHWDNLLNSQDGVQMIYDNDNVKICTNNNPTYKDLFVNCDDGRPIDTDAVFDLGDNKGEVIKSQPSPKRQAGTTPKPSTPGGKISAYDAQRAQQAGVLGYDPTPAVVKKKQVNVQNNLNVKTPYNYYDQGFPMRRLHSEERLINKTLKLQNSLIQAPYNIPETYITPNPSKRKFRNHLYEKNTAPPFIDFGQEELVKALEVIDTTKDYKEALENIYYIRMIIYKSTFNKEKYNYEITEDVADQISEMLGAYMYDIDRIELILSYLFDFDSRDLTVDFRYFGFKPTSSAKKSKDKGFSDEANAMLKELAKPIEKEVTVMVKPTDDDTGFPLNSGRVEVKVKPRDINEEKEYLMKKYENQNNANMQDLIEKSKGERTCKSQSVKADAEQLLAGRGFNPEEIKNVLKGFEYMSNSEACVVETYLEEVRKKEKPQNPSTTCGKTAQQLAQISNKITTDKKWLPYEASNKIAECSRDCKTFDSCIDSITVKSNSITPLNTNVNPLAAAAAAAAAGAARVPPATTKSVTLNFKVNGVDKNLTLINVPTTNTVSTDIWKSRLESFLNKIYTKANLKTDYTTGINADSVITKLIERTDYSRVKTYYEGILEATDDNKMNQLVDKYKIENSGKVKYTP